MRGRVWARPILTGLAHPFFFRYILLHILPPPGLRRSRSSMASLTALLRPPASLLPCSPPHGSGLAPVRRAHSYSSPPPTGLAPALLLPQLTIETTCVADGLAGLAILTVTELEARPQERRPRRPRRRSRTFSSKTIEFQAHAARRDQPGRRSCSRSGCAAYAAAHAASSRGLSKVAAKSADSSAVRSSGSRVRASFEG